MKRQPAPHGQDSKQRGRIDRALVDAAVLILTAIGLAVALAFSGSTLP